MRRLILGLLFVIAAAVPAPAEVFISNPYLPSFPINLQFQKGWNVTASGGGAYNYTITGAASTANSATYSLARPTGSSATDPTAAFYESITDNGVNYTGTSQAAGREVDYQCCTASSVGPKTAAVGKFLYTVSGGETANPQPYVGSQGIGIASANAGGINGTEVGSIFGVNGIARCATGCTYWQNVINEMDVSVENSGSPPRTASALLLSDTAAHATHGGTDDGELTLSHIVGGVGFNTGILIGVTHSSTRFPITTTGTVMGLNSAGTVNYGIDFFNGTDNLTCTLFCFRSNGFSVNGSGDTIARDATTTRHSLSTATALSGGDFVFGTGAGTSPTITGTVGDDRRFRVNITTGISPSSSAVIFTLTFKTAYAAAPYCSITAESAGAGAKITSVFGGPTTTTFVLNSDGTALTASTVYQWSFQCVG
jgi:hypothetical protein